MASEDGEVMSASGIVFASGTRGSCATQMRKGRRVMARYVTAWRATGSASNCSGCFVIDGGKNSLRCARSSAAESARTAMVGKCHSLETSTETCPCAAVLCDKLGGGRSRVRPRGSRRTAAASTMFSVARFFRRVGSVSAMPSLRAWQNCVTGQSKHCGDCGVQSVAPSSIMAWFQSPDDLGSSNASADFCSACQRFASRKSPCTAKIRASTRATLPSSTACFAPYAMLKMAAAVYWPMPGSSSASFSARGKTPPCFATISCAARCRLRARL